MRCIHKNTMNLVIINGPCGVGKSTAAKAVHEKLPLSFFLDIDAQMSNISHYREYKKERWSLAYAIAQSIVETCFMQGRTVVIDKMMPEKREMRLDAFIKTAKKYDAIIHEFILWAPKAVVMQRAHARGWREGGLLTPEKCEQYWEEINSMKSQRRNATVIDTATMDAHAVAQMVMMTMKK
jgi:predicted kinase